jgi:hypothetical protein
MRYLKFFLRASALLATLLWIKNPESHIEPIVAAITLLLSFLPSHDGIQPNTSSDVTTGASLPPAIEGDDQDSDLELQLHGFPYASPTAFFELRFASAFPGERASKWFFGDEAVTRLSALLKAPLVFHKEDSRVEPIWWFRFGNSSITQFKKVSNREVLLDHQELIVEKIYASYSRDYKRLFVYVKCLPSVSTGLYETTHKDDAPYLEQFGYLWEEYGLYKGHMVTRAEHDDNAAVIMGKPVSMEGKSELRTRYITPYNFVICAQDCPINNMKFDARLEGFMRAALTDDGALADLESAVEELPYRRYG